MSILAEKRRKQKWSLNPQGKHWLADSNKFGLKILQGLGWKEGKGLGKQQDGITEPVKISYKNDSKGFGLKETQSSVQQEHFSDLLESLNNSTSNGSPMPIKSLEEKSQNSRSRVHYKKFTRGKDLSRYSKKDLASIFEKKPVETGTEDGNVNVGSMTDYFQKRVPRLQLDKSDSDEEKPGFGFKNPAFEPSGRNFTLVKHKLEPIAETENERDASIIVDDLDNASEQKNEFEVKRKTRKSKRGNAEKKRLQLSCNDKGGIDNPSLRIVDSVGIDDTVHISKKKKKSPASNESNCVKRKKNEQDPNPTIKMQKNCADLPKGVDNPGFNPADVQCDLILNFVEEPVKKRLQLSCNDKGGIDNPLLRIDDSVGIDDTAHVSKKKKKNPASNESNNCVKRKKNEQDPNQTTKIQKNCADLPKGVDNPGFNPADPDVQCDLILNVVEEPVMERKRPKLNKKFKNVGCDNYGFDAKAQRLDENMASLSNTIETYQAEVENDINESKDVKINEADLMVGDFNGGDGENERLKDGGVLLRFKYASFGRDPYWAVKYNQSANLARKSYKHLIRGDITVEFKESNLHEIKGYGNRV